MVRMKDERLPKRYLRQRNEEVAENEEDRS